MKLRGYRRLICCLFVAILFGSGMCVEIKDVDSYLAWEFSQQSEGQKYSSRHHFISSEYCTNELLQRNNSHYIKKDTRRDNHRNLSNTIICSIPWNNRQKLQSFEDIFLVDVSKMTSSREIIIEYIHRQDGEK